MKDVMVDERLSKIISPIATFDGSASIEKRDSLVTDSKDYDESEEFIAIAEGNELPIYLFTYNIEMTQFVYTDLMAKEGTEEIIDKSIPARHHA